MKTNIKVIATSLSLATSVSAIAGMGGLSVQSHLGQPFSGSIVVSGDEARAVIANGSVNVSGGLRASVIKQSEDRVIVRLRSTSPVREPVITFTVSAGRQTREYTAFIDPIRYLPKEAPTDEERKANRREQQQNMRQNQQRTQQDFIERKRTVVERNRVTRNPVSFDDEEMSAETVSTPTAKKSSKVTVSSRRHRAQAGESLANIAERYRPRNMSQQSAMRALMLANPSAFKHGTTIRRNVTLYIPTESQWHAYAQRAQKQAMKERAQQARQARHSQGGSASPTTIERNGVVEDIEPKQPVSKPEPVKPANTATSTPQPAPVKPAQPVQPTKPASETVPATKPVEASKPVEAKASEANKAVADRNKAADTASAVASKASSPVAQPHSQQASTPQATAASKSQAAASAVVGSAVTASSQVSAPAVPVARPKPVAPPPVVEEPVEEETDYMPFILGGVGLGTVVLGGAAYVLSRRRKNGKADNANVNDDDEWEAEDNLTAGKSGKAAPSIDDDEWGGEMNFGSSATKSSTAAQVKPTVIDDGAYFGDDEFSLDKYEAQSEFQPATQSNNEFSLDSKDEFSLDKFDSFDDVAPARKSPSSQDDEWSLPDSDVQPQAVSNQSNHDFVVADEDDWSLDKLDAITEFGNKQAPEQTFSLDDFVVDDIQPAAVEKAAAPVLETVTPVVDEPADFDFSDFVAPSTVSSPVESKTTENAEFNLDSFDDSAAPKMEQAAVADPVFDLDDFVVADKVVETVSTSSPAVELDSFVEPVIAQPSTVIEEDTAFGLDAFEDFALPENNQAEKSLDDIVLPVVDTPVQAQPASGHDDLAFGLDAFEDFTQPETSHAEKALDDIVLPVADAPIQAQPASGHDDLAFGLDAFEDFTMSETSHAEKALDDIVLPAVDEPVQAQPASGHDDLAFGLDAFEDFTLPETNQLETSSVASVASLETFDSLETFVEETVVQSAPVSLDSDLGLDLNAFEDFVPETPSQPETASNNLDLNEFASFENFDEPVIQNNAPAPSMAAFDDTLVAGLDDFVVAEINQAVASVKAQKANDDLGLAAFENFQEPTAVADVVNTPQFDDLASLDTFAVAQTEIQATDSAQPASNLTDDFSSSLEMFDDFAALAQTAEVAPVVTEMAQLDDLASFNLADEIEAVVVPTLEEPSISFDAPAVAEPAISLDVPVVETGLDDLVLDVDLDSATPVGLSQPTASVGMMDLTTGPLAQSSSLDNVNLDTLEVIEDVQDWQQSANADVGFVSGSVNDMTEPLEAKFELAKMYLEIDDAVAARETLRELISESSGEIQAQAKNLLADLGN